MMPDLRTVGCNWIVYEQSLTIKAHHLASLYSWLGLSQSFTCTEEQEVHVTVTAGRIEPAILSPSCSEESCANGLTSSAQLEEDGNVGTPS